jgi:hypothetical protein
MRVTDFCNCTSRHEHLLERSILEVESECFRPPPRPMGPKTPADNPSDPALDGAETSFGKLDHAPAVI